MPTNIKPTAPTKLAKSVPVYRTAEMVSPMHPDKICDRISDAVLDAHLAQDPDARVAVDVAGGHGTVFVTGEITSKAIVTNADIEAIVNRIAGPRTNGEPYEIIIRLAEQSPEIARGVNNGGAGDQGIMVGYACDETPDLLPLEYVLARNLCKYLYELWPYDGKTQVTTNNGKIETIVASFQHVTQGNLRAEVEKWLTSDSLAAGACGEKQMIYTNPAGDWDLGGFDADAGLTGRKIVVDNYGPRVPIGGGAFSGKDLSKVDRSGAYVARLLAIKHLRIYSAKEVHVYLAYAIGQKMPVEASLSIDGVTSFISTESLNPPIMTLQIQDTQQAFEERSVFGHYRF